MKHTLKTILSKTFLSFFILSIVLTACGNPTKEGDGKTPKPGASGEESSAVITFTADEWLRSTYEPLMEEFHKQYPNITVKFAPLPEYSESNQEVFQNYERLLATTADTSFAYVAGSKTAGQYFLDLAPLMEGEPTFDGNDFWKGSLQACQSLDGTSLGIPTSVMITGLYYDEKAFAEAGLPAPYPGWTWDDFREAATALSTVHNGQGRYGYAEQTFSIVLSPMVDQMITESGGKIDTERIQQQAQWYLDLVKEEAIYPPPYMEDPAAWDKIWQKWQEMFASPQRPAMWLGKISDSIPGAVWVNDETNPFKNSAINSAGFAPLPVSADNPDERTSFAETQCLLVSKGSLNPRAAWTWINFLSRQWMGKGKNQMWDMMQIPARKSTVETYDFWKVLPEKAVPALQFALEHAWYLPGVYPMETSIVANAYMKAAAGIGEIGALLENAQAEVSVAIIPTPENGPVVVATPQATHSPDAEVVSYFANLSGKDLVALQELTRNYNENHPEQIIEITNQIDVQGEWFPTLAEKFDCFYWYPLDPASKDYAELIPLDSFLEKESSEFINDYDSKVFKSFTYDGQLYGLPISSDFQMMAYNKDLLLSKGLELPKNDWTMDDFTRMLELVGGGEGDNQTYGYLLDMWDEILFYSQDVKWADLEAEPPVPMLNGQEMTRFVEWLLSLQESGGIFLESGENYAEADQLLRNGKIAFYRTNASQPNGWTFANEQARFEIGVVPFPFFNDPSGSFFMGTTRAQMISRKSENPQACWDWITFLSGQPSFQLGVPARRSILESSGWEAAVGKETAEAMRAAMKHLQPQVPTTDYDPIDYPLTSWRNDAIHQAFAGEEVAGVLNAAQQKSENYLACMKGVEFDQTNEETIQLYVEKIRSCAAEADPEGMMWKSSP